MNKKQKYTFTFIIGLFVLAVFVFSQIDRLRIKNDKAPFFTIGVIRVKDGGTAIHYGIFYQIIKWKRLFSNDKNEYGYLTGVELKYFPFLFYPVISHDLKPGITLQFVKTEKNE